MIKYPVAEKFVSISGEGLRSGVLTVFIRFAGCNLRCSWCDTKWATDFIPRVEETEDSIINYIKDSGALHCLLTGGEPLLQKNIVELISRIQNETPCSIEIETNGSISLKVLSQLQRRPSVTMDYKLPSSGETKQMDTSNFSLLTNTDALKFVIADHDDMVVAHQISELENLYTKTNVFYSPVTGSIRAEEIVNFFLENKINRARIQLQIHKYIWDPDKRGV